MFRYKFFITTTGKSPSLRIRLSLPGNKNTKVATGFRMDEETLENCFCPKPLRKNQQMAALLRQWNAELEDLRLELRSTGETITMPELRSRVVSIIDLDFDNIQRSHEPIFYDAFNEFVSNKTNPGTISVYNQTASRLDAFNPEWRNLKFEDIDLRWLNKFEKFLSQTSCKNARNIHLRNIRAVFNYAIDTEMTNLYPFRRFKIRPEETRKRSLTLEQIREIINVECYPDQQIYRDMFVLMFMLIGINAKDLHSLTEITADGRIEYRRAKTSRLLSIKVEPEAMEIINRYRGKNGLLSISDRWKEHIEFTRKANKALKKLGGKREVGGAGKKRPSGTKKGGIGKWPELSTYWARHTWATIAADLDVPDAVIDKALGHVSGLVAEIYIRRNLRKVDDANRKVLDWVLYRRK